LEVPVVPLTGHPIEDQLKALLAQGLSGYLPKPPRPEELSNLMAGFVGEEAG
jgi:CheY-like chemotaxis protein